MNNRHSLIVALLLQASLAALPAAAHDFWLEPRPWNPAPGDRVALRLRVGEDFDGQPVARRDDHIERFFAVDGEGERPVPGVAGQDPAGWLIVRGAGLEVVGYDSNRSVIELPAAKFEAYLVEEGLERIVTLRAGNSAGDRPGREAFSRCAKTLVTVGDGVRDGYDRPLGLQLELVPLADPLAAGPGKPLPVQLLFRGAPLSDVRVTAIARARPQAAVSGRTDAAGRVELTIDRPGEWLLKAVHMEEASPQLEAEWESWWASLTFALPGE